MQASALAQPGILAPLPDFGRYLDFRLAEPPPPAAVIRAALSRLAGQVDGNAAVVGVGASLASALQARVPGLRELKDFSTPALPLPVTPGPLWIWLRGDAPGPLLEVTRRIDRALAPAFVLAEAVEAFRHGRGPNGHGLDLTGYEDGIENPVDEAAEAAALATGDGLAGSSFVAVQRWQHDFNAFDAMSTMERDHCIGRRRADSEELADAPESAHVKRTAQEDFEPEAFVVRRSMPWVRGLQSGLVFVSFGHSLDAFEAQLQRMTGHDDGITDALFSFSRPVTSAAFWCPPLREGRLDLRLLGV
ncbi:Dyp-type peroxidase [Ramlibacter sp.]|uniref:Dyp-type peroxidase n=1 Tax=Ramlibacter sp. TaxID=1917967 RepID=UPI0035B10290